MPGSQTTVTQDILTGTAAGAAGLIPDHYLWALQVRLQNGSSFTFNPLILSRGFFTNAASILPITVLQVGSNKLVQKKIFKKNTQELSNTQKILSAFASGAGSAILVSPTEYVMTQQNIHGGTFKGTFQYLISEGGYRCFGTGMKLTAIREGWFTAGFLGFYPILKEKTQTICSNEHSASLLAGTIAGIGACGLSHKIDSAKTLQQSSPPSKFLSFSEASKKLTKTQLIKSFPLRLARTVATVAIMGEIVKRMEHRFSNQRP